MNGKIVNRIFLAGILFHLGMVALLNLAYPVFTVGIISNFIISQLLVLVPALTGVLLVKENPVKLAGFHRIKISTVFMVILFTFLVMPLTTLVNAVSMLFVDNTVEAVSGDILAAPFWVILLVVGVISPFCEELVFRGIIYQGYKKTGSALKALLLSALLFALMHMNINQAAYAFVIGAVLVLLVEATGSLTSSVIFHVVFNSRQVILLFLSDRLGGVKPQADLQPQNTTDMLLALIGVYLVIATVATAIAVCVLIWIAKNEKREENLRAFRKFKNNNPQAQTVTVPLLIAVVLSLSFMCLEFIL